MPAKRTRTIGKLSLEVSDATKPEGSRPPSVAMKFKRDGRGEVWRWCDLHVLQGPGASSRCQRCKVTVAIGYARASGNGWYCANCVVIVHFAEPAIVYLPTNDGACTTTITVNGRYSDSRPGFESI